MSRKTLALALVLVFVAVVSARDMKAEKQESDYIKVEIRGTLRHQEPPLGFFHGGIGGKIWTMSAAGLVLEVDFADNKELRQLAEQHNGKTIIATGVLQERGSERPEPGRARGLTDRPIVVLKSLKVPQN